VTRTKKIGEPQAPNDSLGNMRELGVQRLIASCLNDACRHTALIDVRPNWKEQPKRPSNLIFPPERQNRIAVEKMIKNKD
jgi:hypothetical protein